MSIVAKKIMMGSGAVGDPVDDEFNRVSFLSHFDGANNGVNNAFDDGSASNHTITANGNVTQGSFGPFARPDGEFGVSFDGSGNNHLRTTGVLTPASTPTTIECWVFPRTSSVIGLFDGGDGELNILRNYEANKIAKQGQENTGAALSLSVNSWSHLAIVVQSGVIKIYTNGINTSNGSYTGTIANGNTFSIGTINGGSDGKFNGIISNFAAYNTAVYTSNFTPPTAPTTAITATKLLTCQSNRFVDNSAAGRTIALSGAPAVTAFGPFLTSAVYDPAVNGASAFFDGSGDALSTPSMTINGTSNFTLELWTYMTSTGGNRTFATFNDAGGATNVLQFYVRNGEFKLYSDAGGVRTFSGSATRNQWAFIHLSRSGSTATLKVNNVSFGTASSSENINGVLGIGAYVNQSIGDPYKGYMYNYRVSNNIRSSAIPTQPLGTDSNTKLLLNMADGQAIDSAAQNNLTLFGNAKISTGQAKFGDTSLALDGTGDYFEVPNPTSLAFGTGNFTLECWVYMAVDNTNKAIVETRASDLSANGFVFAIEATGGRKLMVYSNAKLFTTSNAISLNTWTHIAISRSGTTLKCFINGTQGASVTNSQDYTNTLVRVGRGIYASSDFNGYIDDLRFSNMARYTANFTAPSEPFADKGQ